MVNLLNCTKINHHNTHKMAQLHSMTAY